MPSIRRTAFLDPLRVVGYGVFLHGLHELSATLSVVTLVQHGLGLLTALTFYVTLRQLGVRSRWVALRARRRRGARRLADPLRARDPHRVALAVAARALAAGAGGGRATGCSTGRRVRRRAAGRCRARPQRARPAAIGLRAAGLPPLAAAVRRRAQGPEDRAFGRDARGLCRPRLRVRELARGSNRGGSA